MNAQGVDVSHWQSTTSWSAAGLSFVFAKASQGSTFTDPAYPDHIAKGRRHGLVVGAYHFNDNRDPIEEQARHFATVAGDVDLYFLDVEPFGDIGFTHTQARTFLRTFCQLTGKSIGLYHSESGFFSGGDYDWVAHWGVTEPGIPWNFHQYRGSPLDLDQYNGTDEELRAFVAQLGDSMPNPSEYLPGYVVTIKPTSNVRTAPKLASSIIRVVGDSGESWPIVGKTKGDLDTDCNGDDWVFWWNNNDWEYTSACNITAGPTAPDTDCSDEMEQAYQDGAASRQGEVDTLNEELEASQQEVDSQAKQITELTASNAAMKREIATLDEEITGAVNALKQDPSVAAYKSLTGDEE